MKLSFAVAGAERVPFAAAPTLALRLAISSDIPVHSILLRCQVRIEPAARGYQDEESARLVELFGDRHRWARTMTGLLWVLASTSVPAFRERIEHDLLLPVSAELVELAPRYFQAVEGEAPLVLLFSGTVFHDVDGRLQVGTEIPWSHEARFGLPAAVWRDTLDHYYPGVTLVRVPR